MSLMGYKIRSRPDEEDNSLEKIWEEYDEAFSRQHEVMERQIKCFLPIKSHRILVKAIILPKKTKSGIILANETRDSNVIYNIGLVIGLGSECYKDKQRFPLGPRCKINDWVSFTPFEKQKEHFNGYLCYIIDDDRVNFPIPDITKAVKEYRGYSLDEAHQIMTEEMEIGGN